jgi:hypothetical protein
MYSRLTVMLPVTVTTLEVKATFSVWLFDPASTVTVMVGGASSARTDPTGRTRAKPIERISMAVMATFVERRLDLPIGMNYAARLYKRNLVVCFDADTFFYNSPNRGPSGLDPAR